MQGLFLALSAVSGAALAYVIASALSNGPSTISALLFTAAVAALVAIFFGTSVLATIGVGSGAVSCVLDETGITLSYGSGRERCMRWRDPHLRIRLTSVSNSTGVSYDITTGLPILSPFRRFPMLNPISAELYSAVLGEVRDRGLGLRTDTSQAHGVSVKTHRIWAALTAPH